MTRPCLHQHPVTPPRGSMDRPGDCTNCGTSYDQARAERGEPTSEGDTRMTDQPYTDDDLRVEAARQLFGAQQDPDFMGIGEQMDGSPIESTCFDAAGERKEPGRTWDQLDDDSWDTAQRSIDKLINGAVDLSDWAVNLGADGLEPDEYVVTAGENRVRVHFAFAPDMSDDDRADIVSQFAAFVIAGLT